MKWLALFACVLVALSCKPAGREGDAPKSARPKLKVLADGFPSGHDTPEGVACDLARSFIQNDAVLFTNTCIRLFGSGQSRSDYADFLQKTEQGIRDEAKRTDAPRGPKAIGKVYAARHLSRNGPASWGYAAFEFQEVMFVDVGAHLHEGGRFLNRTLVIKDRHGKWFVHPHPDSSPLLSAGLNEETPSEQDFSEIYEVER